MATKKKAKTKSTKAAAGPEMPAIKQKYTKTQILDDIAGSTNLSKKQVGAVLDQLTSLIERHVKKRGAGEFTLPGLLKIKAVKKPARKARKNVPNPFKPGELMDVAAKPASIKAKVLPLQRLKNMVAM
jgi:nucleoid DNA-binding protein